MPRRDRRIRPVKGLSLRLSLPWGGARVTAVAMLILAAAAIAALPPTAAPRANAGASVQAIATIRVLSGVRLTFGADQGDASAPRPRLTVIHTADAQEQAAMLFEFE